MPLFRADLHIHTLLSPCGDLSMSPQNIVNKAIEK
jgi:predicted metal-dependent phosphoesterase TrpH